MGEADMSDKPRLPPDARNMPSARVVVDSITTNTSAPPTLFQVLRAADERRRERAFREWMDREEFWWP